MIRHKGHTGNSTLYFFENAIIMPRHALAARIYSPINSSACRPHQFAPRLRNKQLSHFCTFDNFLTPRFSFFRISVIRLSVFYGFILEGKPNLTKFKRYIGHNFCHHQWARNHVWVNDIEACRQIRLDLKKFQLQMPIVIRTENML